MIDDGDYFDQPVNSLRSNYENTKRTTTYQGNDYTAACLLNYPYSWEY